jgi:hypothetical protein
LSRPVDAPVGFHVADHRLDGAAALEGLGVHTALLSGAEDLDAGDLDALVAAADELGSYEHRKQWFMERWSRLYALPAMLKCYQRGEELSRDEQRQANEQLNTCRERLKEARYKIMIGTPETGGGDSRPGPTPTTRRATSPRLTMPRVPTATTTTSSTG